MHASDNAREHVERDPRNGERQRDEAVAPAERRGEGSDARRTHAEEIVVGRPPVAADRPQADPWPSVPQERRRSDRRRIERMSTDI